MKLKGIACGALLALVSFAPSLSAAPIGHLNIDSGGNGVVVSATSIDWLPAAGGTGNMTSSAGTNVAYVGGVLGFPNPGVIRDLPPVPVADFMTFAGHPLLHFDLTGIGPGDTNTNCAAVVAPGDSCSVFAGSPFILTYSSASTISVSLAAFGIARDAVGSSNWFGSFSTQLNQTALSVQQLFLGDPRATVLSSYSGTFDVTLIPVPEPVTMLLLGLGLTGAAYGARRRQ